MRSTLRLLSIVLLTFIAVSEGKPVLTSFGSFAGEDTELNGYGEKETAGEERDDDGREEMEKFFTHWQQVEWSKPGGPITSDFVYKISIKANLHFEVIIPPPQLSC